MRRWSRSGSPGVATVAGIAGTAATAGIAVTAALAGIAVTVATAGIAGSAVALRVGIRDGQVRPIISSLSMCTGGGVHGDARSWLRDAHRGRSQYSRTTYAAHAGSGTQADRHWIRAVTTSQSVMIH